MNFDPHRQQRGSASGEGLGGLKLKLSKKQKSTTIEPPNAMLQNAGNGPGGHSAQHLDRQMQYQHRQTAGGGQKYSSQTRTTQLTGSS